MERTLVLLKPDCLQRRLMGRVITRFEDKGLDLVAMKLMRVTPELARRHYAEHVQKAWYPELEAFITGGPVVAMIVEGPEAIQVVRAMAGATNGQPTSPTRNAPTAIAAVILSVTAHERKSRVIANTVTSPATTFSAITDDSSITYASAKTSESNSLVAA